MPYGAGGGEQELSGKGQNLTPGWTDEGVQDGYEQNPQTGEIRHKPRLTPEGRSREAYDQSIYGRLGEAYTQEQQTLDAYKALERQRLEQTHAQQMGYARTAVAGQAAGGDASMLRGGQAAMGQQARYGATQFASAQAQQDMYFKILEQELLARGASYEEIAQAIADEQQRAATSRAAGDAEAKAARDAAEAAENERAAGIALGIIGAGMSGGMGGA